MKATEIYKANRATMIDELINLAEDLNDKIGDICEPIEDRAIYPIASESSHNVRMMYMEVDENCTYIRALNVENLYNKLMKLIK